MANTFIIAVLLGYLLVGCGIMMVFKGLRGVMATIVIGWIFLPPARGVNLPGLPMYTKEFAVSYAILLGILITDAGRLFSFRPKLLDLPVLVWVLSPLPASITNGLGAYDGMSEVYIATFTYGFPYFLGRIYIRTPNDVKTVAIWFVLAGLIAAPLAIWESRMSPHLNRSVYGYAVAKFHMAKRLGGYRPILFMRHGLEVGLWMSSCSAVALWLWITTTKQTRIFGYKISLPAAGLIVTTVLCRSLGSLILLAGNTAAALFVRTTGLRIALIALVLTPSVYLSVRLSNVWAPDEMTAIIRAFDSDRADSLEARLEQELFVSSHALKQPVFGWGGYNRFRPIDDNGDFAPVDGWTTITLGKAGLVGLVSLLCVTTLPSLLLVARIKGRDLTSAIWAPAIGILLAVSIFALDILFNAFPTPLHLIGIGTLASTAVHAKQWQRIIKAHAAQQQHRMQQERARAAQPPEDAQESDPPKRPVSFLPTQQTGPHQSP